MSTHQKCCPSCAVNNTVDAIFCKECATEFLAERKVGIATHDYVDSSASRWASKKTNGSTSSRWTAFVITTGLICLGVFFMLGRKQQVSHSLGLTPIQLMQRFNRASSDFPPNTDKLFMSEPETDYVSGFKSRVTCGGNSQSELQINETVNQKGLITSIEMVQKTSPENEAQNEFESVRFCTSELTLCDALESSLKGKALEDAIIHKLNPKEAVESNSDYHGLHFNLKVGGNVIDNYRWKFSVTKTNDSKLIYKPLPIHQLPNSSTLAGNDNDINHLPLIQGNKSEAIQEQKDSNAESSASDSTIKADAPPSTDYSQSIKDYPFDISKKYPKAFRAFQKIIPARWRKIDWVYSLSGTAGPLKLVAFEGKKFFLGHCCKPHNCYGNELSFLVAVDGTAAFARLTSASVTAGESVNLGEPDTAAVTLLSEDD